MKSKIRLVTGFLLAGLLFAPAANAGTILYTSLASWETAVGGSGAYVTDDFASGGTTRADFDITKPNGVYAGVFSVGGGVLHDRVGGVYDTLFTFTDYIDAFAADFILSVAGTGSGVRLYADGDLVGSIAGGADVFRGFTSDVAFNKVLFDSAGSIETYDMDNVRYSSVPEPGTLFLLVAGLLGLVRTRRQAIA